MATVIINEDSKQAKAFIAFMKSLPFVKFIKDEDNYNQEFVGKILKSYEKDKRTKIKSDKLWESI